MSTHCCSAKQNRIVVFDSLLVDLLFCPLPLFPIDWFGFQNPLLLPSKQGTQSI
jgi:hypothetical protein